MFRTWLFPLALGVAVSACTTDESPKTDPAKADLNAATSASAPSASASVAPPPPPFPVAVPVSAEAVAKVVNPKNEKPYAGPAASLRGVVRIKGDEPPPTALSFPVGKCGEAAATYGKLFRVGLDGAAADVLVAVTGYQGFVPALHDAVKMTIHGCALSRKTVVAAFGQKIEISNLDQIESFMPYLDGAPKKAVLVAVPRGGPVTLNAVEPGHYAIRDELPNPFLTADVFVLAYATHDVTGLDGKYTIDRIPVGAVRVSAFLPSINKVVEQSLTLKEGENVLDLTLTFDAKKDDPAAKKAAPEAPKAPEKK